MIVSLTSFIKIPEVSEKFRNEFRLSPVKLEGEIKAKPVTTNYSLVGTAFDYLMRFYLEWMTRKQYVREQILDGIKYYALTESGMKMFNITSFFLGCL